MLMIPVETTWREVRPDSYVRDKNGVTWRVRFDRDTRKIVLTNREGREAAIDPPPPTNGVTMMVATEDEALAVVKRELGGIVQGTRTGDGEYVCGPFEDPYRELRIQQAKSHLLFFHGIPDEPYFKTFARLQEAHEVSHEDARAGSPTHGYRPHTHGKARP